MTITYLDPHADVGATQDPYELRLQPVAGTRIALFANMYTDSVAFLRDLAEPLGRALPGAAFTFFDKGSVRNMSFPAAPEFVAEIAAAADAVVLAYGHCGSCTAGVVNDAISLARAGRPVVALVTHRFIEEAHFLARARGLPNAPFVFLPHPVAGQSHAYHQALADAITPAIVRGLRDGASEDCSSILDGAGQRQAS